ncbi:MAG TPA: ABC transporter permease [Dongiaceae bacterium]|jgi:lipopolysaccharide transport system permease protein|nr:ABC transporter permease [Dongiaceae bacterium]
MTKLSATFYSPESSLRHPAQMLRNMFRDLVASRELAWRLFLRDTSAQYRQSLFGYVWAFIPPLMASLPFVFLSSQGVMNIKGTSIPYAAYAMIGTIVWQIFVDALNTPLKIVILSKVMLAKINFPREAIILSGLGQVLFGFLIRLVLLVGIFLWFHIPPPATVFLFPLGVLALILMGTMVGIFLTPFGLLYSDVQMTIPVFTMFLMFLTPVVYPPPTQGLAAQVMQWNPLAPLMVVTRNWLTTGSMEQSGAFFLVLAATLLLLFVGWVIYRLALPHVIARIGN